MIRIIVPFMLSFLMGFQLMMMGFFTSLIALDKINFVPTVDTPQTNAIAETALHY